MSRDTWEGDENGPMSYNKWLYVYSNPVNFTDPTGQQPRDLTTWLYQEMIWNAKNDSSVKSMIILNALSSTCENDTTRLYTKGLAFQTFINQVKNGTRWDFKDEIGRTLGPGITLCTYSGCHTDMEYSIPGNIFYGYIGMASGFSASELKIGAGVAQRIDPAHQPSSEEYVGPYNGEIDKSSSDPIDWNLGDEPSDNVAVTLGIRMWVALCDYNDETLVSNSLVCRAQEKRHVSRTERQVGRRNQDRSSGQSQASPTFSGVQVAYSSRSR